MENENLVCFVCGVTNLPDWEEYKAHIVKEHEEFKHYLMCPFCKFPVRDLKTHWKARHRTLPLPRNTPWKATQWFNVKGVKRTKKREVKFQQGDHLSPKTGKSHHYRSSWELEVYKILDRWDAVNTYESESFIIEYMINGHKKNYYPDLKVIFDHRTEVWEIKPNSQVDFVVNKRKWEAANAYCQIRGWEFIVYTEKGIRELKMKIKGDGEDLIS